MGGGGLGGFIKAITKSPKDAIGFAADPGGLVYTSKNPDVAGMQATIDFGGMGAKSVLEKKATEKSDAIQNEAIAKQQTALDKQTESESAALTRKRKLASGSGAMSLLSGTQLGIDEKKKVLG